MAQELLGTIVDQPMNPTLLDSFSEGMSVPWVAHPELPIVGRAEMFPVRRIYCVGRNYLEQLEPLVVDILPPLFSHASASLN